MNHYVYLCLKVFLTALIIVVVSEVAKVNTLLGAILKSLPLISLLAILWLYYETGDLTRIASFSYNTFWFVLPTLPMFLIFPTLLQHHLSFWLSLLLSLIAMVCCY
jgi:hypothetical protein